MRIVLIIAFFVGGLGLDAQVFNMSEEFQKEIDSYLTGSVPTITVEELAKSEPSELLLLDAREHKEYLVSTIPHAVFIGYEEFDISSVSHNSYDTEIIVFCSIGYRSEKIGEQLSNAGFKNVKNLYGSIFAWANQGLPLVTPAGNETNRLHTYNKKWSKWVDNPKIKKVW